MGGAPLILLIGALSFAGAGPFHLVTLPVEFGVSRRALCQIEQLGLVSEVEHHGAKSVLFIAGMTYVAGDVTSLAYLAYMLVWSRRGGGR